MFCIPRGHMPQEPLWHHIASRPIREPPGLLYLSDYITPSWILSVRNALQANAWGSFSETIIHSFLWHSEGCSCMLITHLWSTRSFTRPR